MEGDRVNGHYRVFHFCGQSVDSCFLDCIDYNIINVKSRISCRIKTARRKKSRNVIATSIVLGFAMTILPLISEAAAPRALPDLIKRFQRLSNEAQAIESIVTDLKREGEERFCYTFRKTLSEGSNGKDVYALNNLLAELGYVVASDRTYFTEETTEAVIAFQEKYRLEILESVGLAAGTGVVGERTRAKLNELFGCKSTSSAKPTRVGAMVSEVVSRTEPLKVLSPNGGEMFYTNTPIQIRWRGGDPSASVTIELHRDSVPTIQIVSDYRNSGSYKWKPAHEIIASATYSVIVRLSSNVSDSSDGVFTIYSGKPSFTFLTPSSGQVIYGGSTYIIEWAVIAEGPGIVPDTFLELLGPNGSSQSLNGNLPIRGTRFKWSVPRNLADGRYTLSLYPVFVASSPAEVEVEISGAAPSLIVLTPNGGETYIQGFLSAFRWETRGIPTDASLSLQIFKESAVVASYNVRNTGYRSFLMPLYVGTGSDFRVDISYVDDDGKVYQDSSDGSFTITTPSITLSSSFIIAAGKKVRSTVSLNARAGSSLSDSVIDKISAGLEGEVIAGPRKDSGYAWWYVIWQNGLAGWSVENYLESLE